MNAIEVNQVRKNYADFSLKEVSLVIPQGTILGLVGENGAGKTTLIKAVMGAIPIDGGEISVMGISPQDAQFHAVKDQIGIVLDESFFPEVLNVDNINVVMRHTYQRWDESLFKKYVSQFDLPHKKAFMNFSRGMKMKLALAVALSHHANLLILDEATSGLDPLVRDEILDILSDFTRDEQNSILISSHILSDLEKICDYIAFIHHGEMIFVEEKDRLMEEYAMVRTSAESLAAMPQEAIVKTRQHEYYQEALVKRALVSADLPLEHTTLEQIFLFLANDKRSK